MTAGKADTTRGTLLNGRVSYVQPGTGYRTGLEPVLLAAAVPTRPGERVLEAGCGAGAGLLCLASRVPGLMAHGIEAEPGMAELARLNLLENGLPGTIHTADVADAAAYGPFHHAFANPPWHNPAGTLPPSRRRALATHGAGLATWLATLAGVVHGSVTFALPAAQMGMAAELLGAAGFGAATIVPLWPKPGRPAKIALLQARRGPGPVREVGGLVLHRADGLFSREADAILRSGAPLAVD